MKTRLLYDDNEASTMRRRLVRIERGSYDENEAAMMRMSRDGEKDAAIMKTKLLR